MKYAALLFCMCFAASVESAAEEKTITIPAPNAEINASTTIIYCDAILGAVLQATEKDQPKSTVSEWALTASIDSKQADRLVIEITDRTLYVHHREDFEKGDIHWGQMWPLDIVKGSTKQGIIAFGYGSAPKSATVTVLSLNRATGVGLWTLSKDTVWARGGPQAKDYPASTAFYLSCGNRKK
jgi:hypothetical protein